jgi:hypothetical protein
MEKNDDQITIFRNELIKLCSKSQDLFEKQLTYVSSGAIAISMAFIDRLTGDITVTHYKFILVSGWLFLTLTLLLNLFSHDFAYRNHYKTIEDIDKGEYDQRIAIQRNKRIILFNKISIILLILGIASIVLFVSINILCNAK